MLCTVVTRLCSNAPHTFFSWTASPQCHVWLQTMQLAFFPKGVRNSGPVTRTTSWASHHGVPSAALASIVSSTALQNVLCWSHESSNCDTAALSARVHKNRSTGTWRLATSSHPHWTTLKCWYYPFRHDWYFRSCGKKGPLHFSGHHSDVRRCCHTQTRVKLL